MVLNQMQEAFLSALTRNARANGPTHKMVGDRLSSIKVRNKEPGYGYPEPKERVYRRVH